MVKSCKDSTFFLTPGEQCWEMVGLDDDEIIAWSYNTYNDSFTVRATIETTADLSSDVKSTGISDSGTVTVQCGFYGAYVTFRCTNIDPHNYSGYIDIHLHIVETIDLTEFFPIIFIITIASIISIVTIIELIVIRIRRR